MTIQITIIGLRQIGASVGLALKDHPDLVKRVGHDREAAITRQAEKVGAVDHISYNLPSSVRQADLVILTEPVDQLLDTLKIILPDLREGVVIMDMAPVKAGLIEQVEKILPPDRHYVSLLPAINPAYLQETDKGLESAHADLFQKGIMLITHPSGVNEEAIKLAADLTKLIGATPLFIDPAEADGLSATASQLAKIAAVALLNATTEQPGWREARKLAGQTYFTATAAVLDLPPSEELGTDLLLNSDNAVRLIDYLAEALSDLRTAIVNHDQEALDERLQNARQARETWLKQRQAAEWSETEPLPPHSLSTSQMFNRLLGFGRPGKERK